MKSKAIILTAIVIAAAGAIALIAIKRPQADHAEMKPAASTSQQVETGPDKVAIANYAFMSDNVTIKVGTTITWKNYDIARHNVESDTGSDLGGPLFGKGETYSHTFNTAGTYAYHCQPHPYMHGKVIVTP